MVLNENRSKTVDAEKYIGQTAQINVKTQGAKMGAESYRLARRH